MHNLFVVTEIRAAPKLRESPETMDYLFLFILLSSQYAQITLYR